MKLPGTLAPNVYCVAKYRPQPHSSMDTHRLGLPNAFIRRWIQSTESSEEEVDGEEALKTTLSGPCSAAILRRLADVKSRASSQLMRCQPGSGSPFGRVRFMG